MLALHPASRLTRLKWAPEVDLKAIYVWFYVDLGLMSWRRFWAQEAP